MADPIKPVSTGKATEPEFFVVFPSTQTFRKMIASEVERLTDVVELCDTEAQAQGKVNDMARSAVQAKMRKVRFRAKIAAEQKAFAAKHPEFAARCHASHAAVHAQARG